MARFGKVTTNILKVYRSIDVRGKQCPVSYGAGILSTTFGPKKWQWEENANIITEYHIDLTGLGVVGTAANDVIGLVAGGVAYFDRYVVAEHGVIYKAEAICLETPVGSATITVDIDVAFNTSGTLEYDGAAGAAELNFGGFAVGAIYAVTTPGALTTTDYMYLVEGDTAATTGVYTGGMLVIRLYGHAVLAA